MIAPTTSRLSRSCSITSAQAPLSVQTAGLVQAAAPPTQAAAAASVAGSRATQRRHKVQAVASGHISDPPSCVDLAAPAQPSMLPSTPMSDHTQIGQHNFWAALPTIRRAIQTATFVALDFEMTGLWADGVGPARLDGYAARYAALKQSASQFLPVQMGISCFEWTGQTWKVQTFNISMYPAGPGFYNPTFSVSADALHFLARQGFDLTSWVNNGSKFMPLTARNAQLAAYDAVLSGSTGAAAGNSQATKRAATAHTSLQAGLEALNDVNDVGAAASAAAASTTSDANADLSRQVQQAWHGHTWPQLSSRIVSWLDQGQQGEPLLELPSTTAAAASFLQALIRLELWCRPDLADFTTSIASPPASGSIDGPDKLAMTTATGPWLVCLQRSPPRRPGEKLPVRGQAARRAAVHKATGPAVLLDIMRAAAVPVVLHHGILDLALLMHHLRGPPLPATWPAYKAQLCKWFPGGIYDSKYLAILRAVHAANNDTAAKQSAFLGAELHRVPLLSWFAQLCDGSIPAPTDSTSSAGPSELPATSQQPVSPSSAPIQHAPGFQSYQAAARDAITHAVALAAQAELLNGDDEDLPTKADTGAAADATSENSVEDVDMSANQPPLRVLAHEAGFDAFMTGAVFTRLLAGPFPDTGTEGHCANPGAQPTASSPAGHQALQSSLLSNVQPYLWRLNGTRGVPYYSLQGADAPPDLPNVFLLTGFNSQTPWWDIAKRWQAAGIHPVHVFILDSSSSKWAGEMVTSSPPSTPPAGGSNRPGIRSRSKAGSTQYSSTGMALVQVLKLEQLSTVMQAASRMDKAWTVRPIQEVYEQQH